LIRHRRLLQTAAVDINLKLVCCRLPKTAAIVSNLKVVCCRLPKTAAVVRNLKVIDVTVVSIGAPPLLCPLSSPPNLCVDPANWFQFSHALFVSPTLQKE
jgi:hypothetical protein